MKTIVITVEGGVIQDISNVPRGVKVKVLDFDVEGVDESKLTTLPNGEEAVVSEWGGRK